jgi:hypothetical protein
MPLARAIPRVAGQVLLEGEAGAGKTTFLRFLLMRARMPVAFMHARNCGNGVVVALLERLRGVAIDDEGFIEALLHAGALGLCIDALNEAPAEVRAEIDRFLDEHPRADVVLASRPIHGWQPPARLRRVRLEPLDREQMLEFLLTQEPAPQSSTSDWRFYAPACRVFVREALVSLEEGSTPPPFLRVLENPMDLSVAATVLAHEELPELPRLYPRLVALLAADYERAQSERFPLASVAETAYTMKLDGARDLDALVLPLLRSMWRQRVVMRQATGERAGAVRWVFRHENVCDYLVAQAVAAAPAARQAQHLADERFDGVYRMMALWLDADAALRVGEVLAAHAVDARELALVQEYLEIVRARMERPSAEP